MITALLVLAAISYASWYGASPSMLIAVALLCLIPSSELAMAFVQKFASRLIHPEPLPRLEFTGGVPEESRTIVVIPTLLTSIAGVESLLDHLEVVSIANHDPRIHFAILSDHADSPTRVGVDDEAILAAARLGIEMLNQRAAGDPGPNFSCFTAIGNGTSASRCGWAGKGSAASSKSSTGWCAAQRTPASPRRSVRSTRSPASSTASRSIRTRSCRAMPRAS